MESVRWGLQKTLALLIKREHVWFQGPFDQLAWLLSSCFECRNDAWRCSSHLVTMSQHRKGKTDRKNTGCGGRQASFSTFWMCGLGSVTSLLRTSLPIISKMGMKPLPCTGLVRVKQCTGHGAMFSTVKSYPDVWRYLYNHSVKGQLL